MFMNMAFAPTTSMEDDASTTTSVASMAGISLRASAAAPGVLQPRANQHLVSLAPRGWMPLRACAAAHIAEATTSRRINARLASVISA